MDSKKKKPSLHTFWNFRLKKLLIEPQESPLVFPSCMSGWVLVWAMTVLVYC